ncbi:MAG TPA: hypothetical protein VFL97_06070 [Nitrococcus sp.]|nr:hypothetical protein [Nitrococcus sp.]
MENSNNSHIPPFRPRSEFIFSFETAGRADGGVMMRLIGAGMAPLLPVGGLMSPDPANRSARQSRCGTQFD